MGRRRNIYFIIIVACLIYAVSDYFIAMRQSYDKYVSGEYYFRQKAYTVDTHSDSWVLTPEAQNTDYSDPKNVLLSSNNVSVYAVDPHDGVCTVYYGDNVIEDFPISNLRFENDDAEFFYGRKTYTYDEYIDIVGKMSKDELKSLRVSDKRMANFNEVKDSMFILIVVDIGLAIILFLLYRGEQDHWFNVVMLIGALYGVFFEIMTAVLYSQIF